MEPGQIWAYRETGKHPLVPVRFLRRRRGTGRKYQYSLVRFEAPEADGLEEWVPDGRLKCHWADAEAFLAREKRWTKLQAASKADEATHHAVDAILIELDPQGLMPDADAEGVREILDAAALSELSGILESALTSEPEGFWEGGKFQAPVATAIEVAKALARRYPDVVLRSVEREESDLYEQESRWRQLGCPTRSRQSAAWDDALRRSFEMRREWVGEHTVAFNAELLTAHMKIQQLSELVEYAAKMLKANGHTTTAAKLMRALNE